MWEPTKLYETNNGVIPDDYDKGMVDTYLKEWNSHFRHDPSFPRIGDYIIMPDGSYQRASHVWPDGAQTSEGGSYYLGCGFVGMSGGLNPTIPFSQIKPTGETKTGTFWTFHHDDMRADNGIGIKAVCRVFKVIS